MGKNWLRKRNGGQKWVQCSNLVGPGVPLPPVDGLRLSLSHRLHVYDLAGGRHGGDLSYGNTLLKFYTITGRHVTFTKASNIFTNNMYTNFFKVCKYVIC